LISGLQINLLKLFESKMDEKQFTESFVKHIRKGGYKLLTSDPKAYLLLAFIAFRAKRTDEDTEYSTLPLEINQAIISDYEIIGLSRSEYRNAQKRLTHYGLAVFATNSKGTIATLTSIDAVDINADHPPTSKEPPNLSMKIHEEQPSKDQPKSSQEPLTRREEEKEATTTEQQVALYECLEKYTKLSYEEKKSLMIYPESKVLKALEWVQPGKVKQSLIGLLHWYCRQEIPPDKSSPPGTEQQIEAWQYNQFLKEHSINDLYEKNLLSIPDNHAHVILDARKTTISLNNQPHQVRLELEQSKIEMIKRYNLS